MTCRPASLGGAAAALLLLACTPAQANLIHWSYSWSRNPAEVPADAPGTGFISLTDESELRPAAGDSDIVATNLRTHSTAPKTDPDTFTAKVYSLSLFLQDDASGQSTTLAFAGQFDGTLSANSANIMNTFLGETTQSVVLGNTRFTVTIGPFASPGPPDATNEGSIGAHAQVQVEQVMETPEPGTLALSSLGGVFLAWAAWRRRRRPSAAPLAA
jgi:hypothetical protein